MEYKGFQGTAEYSESDHVYYGKVINVNGLISYEGDTLVALESNFMAAIDEYIRGDNFEENTDTI